MEQTFDGVDEIYNQRLGEVLRFFASKLQLYYSSSRLTFLLTLWDLPADSFRYVATSPYIIPLLSKLKMVHRYALSFFSKNYFTENCYIFRDFLDSGHPLALNG